MHTSAMTQLTIDIGNCGDPIEEQVVGKLDDASFIALIKEAGTRQQFFHSLRERASGFTTEQLNQTIAQLYQESDTDLVDAVAAAEGLPMTGEILMNGRHCAEKVNVLQNTAAHRFMVVRSIIDVLEKVRTQQAEA